MIGDRPGGSPGLAVDAAESRPYVGIDDHE